MSHEHDNPAGSPDQPEPTAPPERVEAIEPVEPIEAVEAIEAVEPPPLAVNPPVLPKPKGFRAWAASEEGFRTATWVLFGLAVLLRVLWAYLVQHPKDAIYSDMGGYIHRALDWSSGRQNLNRYLACYPYGGHYFYGVQYWLFGHANHHAVAVVHILIGAAVTPLTMWTARRVFLNPYAPLWAGLFIATWHQQLLYTGYFSSEQPYAFFLALTMWGTVRLLQTGRGAFGTALNGMFAFTIRPQMVLTLGLTALWLVVRRKSLWWRTQLPVVLLLAAIPVVGIAAYSIDRAHWITGQYHLISENGAIGRMFADTDCMVIEEWVKKPNGSERRLRLFGPPATHQMGNTRVCKTYGYISDKAGLDEIRLAYITGKDIFFRLHLLQRNITPLAYKNTIWPERNQARKAGGFRKFIHEASPWVLGVFLVPFAFIGLISMIWRRNLALEFLLMHVATSVYAAARYFAELRYRTPYDSVLLILAMQGVLWMTRTEPPHVAEGGAGKPPRWLAAMLALAVVGFLVLMFTPWLSLTATPDVPVVELK
jgi:hypothetical protein